MRSGGYFRVLAAGTIVLAMCLGCGPTRNEQQELTKRVESLHSEVAKVAKTADLVRLDIVNSAPSYLYDLYDIRREQRVGYLRTHAAIAQNDRVFLGDDMWDVKFVKVFTSPTPDIDCTVTPPPTGYTLEQPAGVTAAPCYRLDHVQLLVSFGGKAIQPKSKSAE